ncbi:DUF3231 family protein [Bacillus mangrovi]|uniref:DUF3231 family protein n=1 Tax=Metabacillus mangrovi TaxID=1491830 RepID=A0A7X2S7K0_9BACI|nr:DUF3231 family protein [Metabacillus mangrovi]MTH54745.1 DUF3231 family protein [Metabacillus mangrovi]
MAGIFESIISVMKENLDGEPKPPLHVGEVMALWTLYTMYEEAKSFYGVFLNITTDLQLKHSVETAKKDTEKAVNLLKEFLKAEGVPLPNAGQQDKPDSNPSAVPPGVRFTDDEIANFIGVKTAAYISMMAAAIAQSIRTDVAAIFASHMMEVIKYDAALKSMMIKKGWLKVPPYYLPTGSPRPGS